MAGAPGFAYARGGILACFGVSASPAASWTSGRARQNARALIVTASMLMAVFDAIYLVAMSVWVGSVLFVSFGVAPLIFQVLDPEASSRFVRALFPRYYLWGAISGAIALPCAVAVPLAFPELRGPGVGLRSVLILASTLVMLYAGNVLSPQINAARDSGAAGQALFERLHKRSVRLNGVVLLVGLGLLVAFAARPLPRTSGIVEPGQTARTTKTATPDGPVPVPTAPVP